MPCHHSTRPTRRLLPGVLGLLAICAACFGGAATAWAIDAQTIFQRSGPSVVVVVGKNAMGKPFSFGSGFFVRDNLVATNHHVVEKASSIEIRQGQDQPIPVRRIKATDKDNDLAILLVEQPGSPLPLKDGHPKVGEEVIAIGNPRGLERTVSPGIVSGLRKDQHERMRYQITAPISPGSSGGPILDANGEVIGLATFFIMAGQNLNFAVPSLYVEQLLEGGGSDSGRTLQTRQRKQIEVKQDADGVITIQ